MTTPSHTPVTVPDADPLTAAREALRRGDLHAGKSRDHVVALLAECERLSAYYSSERIAHARTKDTLDSYSDQLRRMHDSRDRERERAEAAERASAIAELATCLRSVLSPRERSVKRAEYFDIEVGADEPGRCAKCGERPRDGDGVHDDYYAEWAPEALAKACMLKPDPLDAALDAILARQPATAGAASAEPEALPAGWRWVREGGRFALMNGIGDYFGCARPSVWRPSGGPDVEVPTLDAAKAALLAHLRATGALPARTDATASADGAGLGTPEPVAREIDWPPIVRDVSAIVRRFEDAGVMGCGEVVDGIVGGMRALVSELERTGRIGGAK